MKKILPLFSYLFHPLFIPVFGALLYLFGSENYFSTEQKYLILSQICIILVLLPITVFYLLKTLGKADSVMLSMASQRKIPLIIQAVLILVLVQKSITDSIPELHYFFYAGLASTIIAFLLLFVDFKASLHMIGISSLTGFAVGLSLHNQTNDLYIIAFLLATNGLVATSRLEMQAHTEKEIILGFILGLVPQALLWFLWL